MCTIQPTTVKLRPYGTTHYLETIRKLTATLTSAKELNHKTMIYKIYDKYTEILLGDTITKSLDILNIVLEGKHPSTKSDTQYTVKSITEKLANAGILTTTQKEKDEEVSQEEQTRINNFLQKYESVFKDIGLLKQGDKAKFNIDSNITPVTAPYRSVPLVYREKSNAHLKDLRENDKIEDISPTKHSPWISNVVILEK